MDDLVVDFLTETNESLEELDNDLVHLEQNPNDKDLLSKIFRLMHTIKGTCGFLDLPKLAKVAHHAENVLGRFRDGDLQVTPAYVTLIFESLDAIKYIVSQIEQTGKEPDRDYAELIEKLDIVYEGRDGGGSDAAPAAPVDAAVEDIFAEAPAEEAASEPTEDMIFEPVPAASMMERNYGNTAAPSRKNRDPTRCSGGSDGAEHKESALAAQTLRVNVDVLENLMTMVSELVLTRNQLLLISRTLQQSDYSAPLQRLNQVVSELQDGVMKTRMQPIGNAWSKLPRIIRDLAMELGKKIDLEMRGQDTELDRQVLELIKDPLTHMVRNSADHGVEDIESRKKAGKPETGKILLNAFHEGGHIIIQISDDGKGLAVDRIRRKAIENGLATEDELNGMSPSQIQQFIFRAGFSTAEKVTSVSGRGVGMDVVRTNIEKIGGSIELKSVEGEGSTFTIKIPLTLAIVSALIVESGGERFAIPQLSVQELVLVSAASSTKIESIKGTPVYRLRDRLLPLLNLSNTLKLEDERDDEADMQDRYLNKYLVVTHVGGHSFGIIVDKVFDTEEIVVKPVAQMLRGIELFSGNTILGDGSVIMILDPNGLARASGELDVSESKASTDQEATGLFGNDEKTSLLLFRAGDSTPKTVPLSLVARLENFKMSNIEHSGDKMVIQYRGALMPLVPFNHGVHLEGADDKPVLVFSDKGQSMGIIVDEIVDITEEFVDVQTGVSQPGIMGSAIIAGKATDVIDIGHFLNSLGSQWFKDHDDTPFTSAGEAAAGRGHNRRHVLLVDDSPFFRNMIVPLLRVAGYDVTSTDNAGDALKLCENGAQFDVIVSDIEMPEMDGFEFARKIKTGSNWQDTPLVALTSHATPQDIERGLEVGFYKYIAKFDKDTLLTTIRRPWQNKAIRLI
ncbi:MAG: chemotaxis protein CheW [Alphaproteobacteria bacterium]|nr:chemotaxis protein CheW [Alphaproteobacteria bacterium]